MDNQYDVIIIGGSYAGLAAGMALGRALRRVLIIDSGQPCNRQTPHSHNFLTRDGQPPAGIAALAREQVSLYDTVHFLDDLATAARQTENGFEIQTGGNRKLRTRKLVLATGIKDLMPPIPGFADCWGISALHCPYCHGYEVRGEQTGILANGDTAFEMASLIANWTPYLTVYTNGAATLDQAQRSKLATHQIRIIEKEISHLEQEQGYIRNLVFSDGSSEPLKALYTRPPFVQHSDIAERLGCELTKEGYIEVDPAQKTGISGVFACGDNTTRMRTVANAVAQGTTTGLMVNKELIEEDF